MKYKLFFYIIFFLNINYIFSQNIIELKDLDRYDFIAGPSYGYSGNKSPQWVLYEMILEKYPSELVEDEYYKTNSIVSKIYLYWVLREKNWDNLLIVYNDLKNHYDEKLIFAPGGCIVLAEPIEIEYIINFNYYDIQETIDDPLINLEYINTFVPLPEELYELLLKEYLLEILRLPQFDIEFD